MTDFVHLHLHTQYSVLDGANRIERVIELAKASGQKAVAITDHGNMFGAVEFYSAAKEAEVKPIIGCEVYITPGSRHEKIARAQGGAGTHHLTLLCENETGYRNLCRLVTLGYTEGFYSRPRIDFEVLEQYNEGLICLSGCMAGELAKYTRQGRIEPAVELAQKYARVFSGRYFLEVQPHRFAEQQDHNQMLKHISKQLGLPLVATNDVHYPTAEDHYAQEVLMCVSTGKLITDETRIRHEHSRLHFKSAQEMLAEMPDFAEGIAMSAEIARRCNVGFDFKTYHMPQFKPEEENGVQVPDIDALFAEQSSQGLQERIAQATGQYQQRILSRREEYDACLAQEIGLIKQMGFAGYFLVVSDFIKWAKRHDIPVGPGRGSAAGSLVAWALSITEIDPIEHKLLFERFLNPERISLPDIDVDFCINGRERVIEYVCNKYGKENVAQIVTFGTLKAKAAIRDVGRVLGLSFAETDRIAKLIPAPRQGFDYPLSEALKMEKRLREYAEGEGRELISLAEKLEGLTRHTSTHAAGVVISNRPVVEHMPLMLDKDGQIVTQFSMGWVEKIGLVKFDFLGLKTLSVLQEAVRLVRETLTKDVNLNALPLDDSKPYRLISSGRTIGVFQLESSGITETVVRMKPNCFEDIVAILALYRPGPLDAGMVDHYINRKHGREPVRYLHPLLKPILQDTYGIILYQEQIMQIARDMAGYSLGGADLLRRAMGKKKPEEMAKQRQVFIAGATKNGIEQRLASEVFDQMETFARYGFNRSHSVAYAMISYQTAYMKAHFPAQFMAALMTFEMGDTDKTLKNINECKEMNIPVMPPNINFGDVGFGVVDKKIVFGLAAVKGVGEKAVENITVERKKSGSFRNLSDFCRRFESGFVNRRLLENFIKGGAFDGLGATRAKMLERLDDVIKYAQRLRDEVNSAQMSLFGGGEAQAMEDPLLCGKEVHEAPQNIKLAMEREALGFYLSGHPLERFREELNRLGSRTIESLKSLSDGSQATVAGVITFLKLKNTKKGDRYATFTLEDLLGTIEVIVWPDTYQKIHAILESQEPIVVVGRVDVSDQRSMIVANDIQSAIELRNKKVTQALIRLDSERHGVEKLAAMKRALQNYRGECLVKLSVSKARQSDTIIVLPKALSVSPSEELSNELERVFGEPVLSFR